MPCALGSALWLSAYGRSHRVLLRVLVLWPLQFHPARSDPPEAFICLPVFVTHLQEREFVTGCLKMFGVKFIKLTKARALGTAIVFPLVLRDHAPSADHQYRLPQEKKQSIPVALIVGLVAQGIPYAARVMHLMKETCSAFTRECRRLPIRK